MLKKKLKLQQQIFLSFFLIVSLLMLIQFFVTWSIFSIQITQTENEEISSTLSNIQKSISTKQQEILSNLIELSENAKFISILQDSTKINSAEDKFDFSNLTIYNENRKIIVGSNWVLMNDYLDLIYQKSNDHELNLFFAEFSGKTYLFVTKYIKFDGELKGIIIHTEPFNPTRLIGKQEMEYNLITATNDQNQDLIPVTVIENIRTDLTDQKTVPNIIRPSNETAYGIILLNDLKEELQSIIFVSYEREMNKFMSKGILFFALVVLAISFISASFVGIWFSQSIMQPVKEISTRISEISHNPSDIKPFTDQFTGVLGDITDVFSEMSLALIENRQALLQYKAITDNINSAIFFMDENLDVLVCNPAFLNIFQRRSELKLNLSDLTNLDPKKLYEIGTSTNHSYYFSIEVDNIQKYLILDLNISQEEEDFKYFGSITDETLMVKSRKDKQSLELELIRSNRLSKIGKLLVGVVHNLNSHLNSIVGYSQFLKQDFPENSDISRLHESSQKISSMVKGLLNKNRNENRSMPQNLNVNEIIDDELEMCQHNLFFKHYIIINKELSENIKSINAVYSDISLCVANVLNNAIDAMQESVTKELTVQTFMQGTEIMILIRDTGCGIPAEKLEKIFDINYSSKFEKNRSGFGLGLALTKAIVNKCNGKIEVDSTVDMGTSFKLYFPTM